MSHQMTPEGGDSNHLTTLLTVNITFTLAHHGRSSRDEQLYCRQLSRR